MLAIYHLCRAISGENAMQELDKRTCSLRYCHACHVGLLAKPCFLAMIRAIPKRYEMLCEGAEELPPSIPVDQMIGRAHVRRAILL